MFYQQKPLRNSEVQELAQGARSAEAGMYLRLEDEVHEDFEHRAT